MSIKKIEISTFLYKKLKLFVLKEKKEKEKEIMKKVVEDAILKALEEQDATQSNKSNNIQELSKSV